MKKLKGLLLVLMLLLVSCVEEPVDNWKSAIVVDKFVNAVGGKFQLKYYTKDNEWKFAYIYVVKYDFDRYHIGDTIK